MLPHDLISIYGHLLNKKWRKMPFFGCLCVFPLQIIPTHPSTRPNSSFASDSRHRFQDKWPRLVYTCPSPHLRAVPQGEKVMRSLPCNCRITREFCSMGRLDASVLMEYQFISMAMRKCFVKVYKARSRSDTQAFNLAVVRVIVSS